MRERIVAEGGSLRPSRPGGAWMSWRNRALRSKEEADTAIEHIRGLGLVPHQDGPKNWDLLVAVGEILRRTSHWSPVLEMGAARYSPLLTWLYLYGYRHLRGIDLVYGKPVRRGPIRLEGMDLTATTYADHSVAAIACLSVIEHGVDTDAYLREARRLLRPGGVLVTSTDYWPDPVDTTGREAYGHPVRIFDRDGITGIVESAEQLGFRLVGPLDTTAGDRVVHWERTGLDYTFLVLVFTAPPGGPADRIRTIVERVLP